MLLSVPEFDLTLIFVRWCRLIHHYHLQNSDEMCVAFEVAAVS